MMVLDGGADDLAHHDVDDDFMTVVYRLIVVAPAT